ncbi:MAG: hypothetical protein WBQ72_21810 [Terriglobales bacterium]
MGRLFQFEKRHLSADERTYGTGRVSEAEFFWLCEECAAKYTLVRSVANCVELAPVKERAPAVARTRAVAAGAGA